MFGKEDYWLVFWKGRNMVIEYLKCGKLEVECFEDDVKVCFIVEGMFKEIEICGDVVVCEFFEKFDNYMLLFFWLLLFEIEVFMN